MMNKLAELLSYPHFSFSLETNMHNLYGQFIEEYLEDDKDDLDKDVYQAIVEKNYVVKLQMYCDTDTSFYLVIHHDVDAALDQMLGYVKNHKYKNNVG